MPAVHGVEKRGVAADVDVVQARALLDQVVHYLGVPTPGRVVQRVALALGIPVTVVVSATEYGVCYAEEEFDQVQVTVLAGQQQRGAPVGAANVERCRWLPPQDPTRGLRAVKEGERKKELGHENICARGLGCGVVGLLFGRARREATGIGAGAGGWVMFGVCVCGWGDMHPREN